MATRESRAQRGRRRGNELQAALIGEVRRTRRREDVSQREMAARLGWSQTEYWRLENLLAANIGLPDIAACAALLGLELSAALHPAGDPIADRGQQAVIARLRRLIGAPYTVFREAPLPNVGDRRAWDLLLRLDLPDTLNPLLVGIEVETKVRDVQALVRKLRLRERDGGVDHILVVLADTRTNRRLAAELRDTLGPRYATPARDIITALRAGRPLPGSGVVLV